MRCPVRGKMHIKDYLLLTRNQSVFFFGLNIIVSLDFCTFFLIESTGFCYSSGNIPKFQVNCLCINSFVLPNTK